MEFDLIIVGGGINGCGIARDASMRGLKTLLVEKTDFAVAASGNNSQMIHGGARYLTSDLKTTRLSSLDSGYIQKIAPHLIFRIPFLFPILKEHPLKRFAAKVKLELVDAFFRAYDHYGRLKNAKPHVRLSKKDALKLEPDLTPEMLGAVSFDEFGIDSPRLCLVNALSAYEHGAVVKNHTEVTDLIFENGQIRGVKLRDILTGSREEYRGKWIINATGPWAPRLAKKAGAHLKVRPTKGIHISFEGRFTNMALLAEAIDGRSIFLMPHQNTTLLGTTDDDYFGDLDDVHVLEDEVEYLLEGIERVFPSIRQARMIRTWAGIRPTLYKRACYEDHLSREHEVVDHEHTDGVSGFISVIGGKLASYRLLAKEVTDFICQKMDLQKFCRTHLEPLPGGEEEVDITELARQFRLNPFEVSRLAFRHGARTKKVLGLVGALPANANVLCACEPVLAAEIRYVARHEFCKTLDDLRRRTRFSLGACQGSDCIVMAAQVLGEELGWDAAEVFNQVRQFLQKKWKERAPTLRGVQVTQEELNAHRYFNVGNFHIQ